MYRRPFHALGGFEHRFIVLRQLIPFFLVGHDVKMIVVACNTVSSVALEVVQKHSRVPVVGVIVPGAGFIKDTNLPATTTVQSKYGVDPALTTPWLFVLPGLPASLF